MKKIFVHGLGQTSDSWRRTIYHIKDNSEIICPDLTCIIKENEASYSNLYEKFSDICDKIKEPVNLCGLSLGGMLSLNYAVDNPEKINSLILIATQYKSPKKLLQFQNLIFKFIPDSRFLQTGLKKSDFINLCKTMMSLDFSQFLSNISCPVLVICGEKDKANKKASLYLAETLKGAELKLINGSGHEVNIDSPDELALEIQNFYDNLN
ncbi:MAG: alpha/beta hydrolase [Ruminococcus sp.]|nr:alpha/beta hydrolase [Ruminococcus sp.]